MSEVKKEDINKSLPVPYEPMKMMELIIGRITLIVGCKLVYPRQPIAVVMTWIMVDFVNGKNG